MIYILILSILANFFFGFFCIKFALLILNVQDAIEASLNKIDAKYNRLGQINKIPVFYDSPEIKNIIGEIIEVQDIVLEVATTLSNSIDKKKEKTKEEEKSSKRGMT